MNYGLYTAIVVKTSLDDNRLQVKILPQMMDIAPEDCPLWPYFFKDELLIPNEGDLVWVICNNDFSNGYILGLANYSTYKENSFVKYSIPKGLKEAINNVEVELKASKLSFTNLKVIFWNNHCIHFIERSTGRVIYAFNNGTIYKFGPDEFSISLKGKSLFRINGEDTSINSSSVKIQSPDVELGNNPTRNVLITLGSESGNAEPSKYVKA